MVKRFLTTAEDWSRLDKEFKEKQTEDAKERIRQYKLDYCKSDEWEREILELLFEPPSMKKKKGF